MDTKFNPGPDVDLNPAPAPAPPKKKYMTRSRIREQLLKKIEKLEKQKLKLESERYNPQEFVSSHNGGAEF